jgi:hypothetical protein
MNTYSLSKFLCESGSGFTSFQLWINNTPEFAQIIDKLNFECKLLLDSKWLERTKRKDIINNITKIIKNHFTSLVGTTSEDYFHKWTDSIREYCKQGGFGHIIVFNGCPHHYVILPEYYNTIVKDIPNLITIASIICNSGLNIYPTPTYAKWGN